MPDFIDKYIRAGKSIPLFYYIRETLFNLIPRSLLARRRKRILRGWEQRPDADEIRERVDFYCPLKEPFPLSDNAVALKDIRPGKFLSRYAYDAQRSLRYWPGDVKVDFQHGDIWENPDTPTLMKGRRLDGKNEGNAVILNLDRIRHFLRPKDTVPFEEKIPKLFFRGDIFNKPARIRFFEQWADNPLFDLGDTCPHTPSRWAARPVSVPEHFKYRFILALEGYDVASALQWIMASGCVPVMTRPTVEGWLMHSRLVPGKHYIEIAPDFSDVGEKIAYYAAHPDEAEAIARESRRWAERFFNPERERIISLLVAERYLSLAQQNPRRP